jgi:hypothetical protein
MGTMMRPTRTKEVVAPVSGAGGTELIGLRDASPIDAGPRNDGAPSNHLGRPGLQCDRFVVDWAPPDE